LSIMNNMIDELRMKIVETLNLEDVEPEDIGDTDRLLGGDLGVDSIDLLELVMMIEKDYGVRIDNEELATRVFANLETLATYIHEHSAGGSVE